MAFYGFDYPIVLTIKYFEKALHGIFPCLFLFSILSNLLSPSAPSKISLGPNDISKEPHLKAHSGPFAKPFGPKIYFKWAGGLLLI